MAGLTPTAQRALNAYGGRDRWAAARAVEATVRAGGIALPMKLRRPIAGPVRCDIQRPRTEFPRLYGGPATGVLDGGDVRIEDADGRVVASREDARSSFPGGRRTFWWDRLDVVYFAGYALWNYLTFPALLLRDDIAWSEPAAGTLEARFPPRLPTHCDVQRFHFDAATGLLRQHDYTAEVFGGWARAAHVVLEHETWEGIPYPSRRRVTPRGPGGRPLPLPVLVSLRMSDWRLV